MSHPSKELSEAGLDALIARERTRVVAPLTEWHALAGQLRQEGLIRNGADARSRSYGEAYAGSYSGEYGAHRSAMPAGAPVQRRGVMVWGRRLIMSAALFGIGAMVGRASSVGEALVDKIEIASDAAHADSMTAAPASFTSPDQATRVLVKSQADWQRAAAYLTANSADSLGVVSPAAYQERLAALDKMMSATHSALQEAPDDPVLNQYYMSAFGARQATVQRLNQVLPVGARLTRY